MDINTMTPEELKKLFEEIKAKIDTPSPPLVTTVYETVAFGADVVKALSKRSKKIANSYIAVFKHYKK